MRCDDDKPAVGPLPEIRESALADNRLYVLTTTDSGPPECIVSTRVALGGRIVLERSVSYIEAPPQDRTWRLIRNVMRSLHIQTAEELERLRPSDDSDDDESGGASPPLTPTPTVLH